MMLFKKLLFGVLTIPPLYLFFKTVNPFIQSPLIIFSLDSNVWINLTYAVMFLALAGMSWSIFILFSSNWKLNSGIIFFNVLSLSLLGLSVTTVVLIIGMFIIFIICTYFLSQRLLSYLNFSPTALLIPSIKQLLILTFFFVSIVLAWNSYIDVKGNGVIVPGGLVDALISLTPQVKSQTIQSNLSQDVIKATVTTQINELVKPYQDYLPLILGLMFFASLQSISALLSLLLTPILWLLFFIFTKTGFIKFDIETREIKKLVV